jgi:hypothetical protein
MVVFCHNPHVLPPPPQTPCSQGKQLGKFLAPIGLKLITYIFTNYPARSEISWGANKFVCFRLFICTYITKQIYPWCTLRSSANNVHAFSVKSGNVKEGCNYMRPSVSTRKQGSAPATSDSMKVQVWRLLDFFHSVTAVISTTLFTLHSLYVFFYTVNIIWASQIQEHKFTETLP